MTCPLCGDHLYDGQLTQALEKARVHAACRQRDGRSTDELAALLPCCNARHVLRRLGGILVEECAYVPEDEIWAVDRSDPSQVLVRRYRILANGVEALESLGVATQPESVKAGGTAGGEA